MTSTIPDRRVTKTGEAKSINWAYPLGFWSALITTVGGVVYFLVIVGAITAGQFTFPPSGAIQLFGGISSLLFCPLLVILFACLHTITPVEKKALSQICLAFTVMFALAVSINRFTQLGAVRQSIQAGVVDGIEWFDPYGARSFMFGLEMMGWGWFFGLAMLSAAPLFSGGRLQRWLRWLCVCYGVLGMISAVAYLLASPLSVIGFAAWGLVLFLISGLLAVYFRESQYPDRA
jgi:hypothetical protein